MNELLNSIKIDLLDRRLRPYVALVAAACVAAIAFAVLGGSSSSSSSGAGVAAAHVNRTPGIATSTIVPEKAVAETTNGTSEQRHGVARNPFTPLVRAPVSGASSSSSSSTAPSTSSSSSSASTGSSANASRGTSEGGGGGSTTPSKSSKPSKPKTKVVSHVTVLFGEVPAGTAPLTAQLTEDQDLKLLTPLPNATEPVLVYRGVTAKGKSATFTVVGEAFPQGQGACLPSATQCQAIDLAPGRYEQFEVLTPTGQVVTYELRVVKIEWEKTTASAARNVLKGQSKQGLRLLREDGLTQIPFLRPSAQVGVLVFGPARAVAARAHVALSGGVLAG